MAANGADRLRFVTDIAEATPRPISPRLSRRASSRPSRSRSPRPRRSLEIAPNVIRMQLPIWMPGLGHVNMYGLLDDRGLAVVDPGLPGPSSWKALKQRLKTAGFRLKDVHTVVVTHSHPDHFGGAGRIRKETRRRADRAPRVHHVVARGVEPSQPPADRAGGARGGADRGRPRPRRSTSARRRDPHDRRPLRRLRGRPAARRPDARVQRAVGAVGWRDAVGRVQAPDAEADAPHGDQGDAHAVRAAGPEPPRPPRRAGAARGPRVGERAHAGPHDRPPLPLRPRVRPAALGRPRAAVDHAAHLRRGQRRRRAAELHPDPRPRGRARRREARAPRARAPVRRRARPGARRSRSTTRSAWSCSPHASIAIGPATVQQLSHEIFPQQALGRDGRERDVRPPRAHGDRGSRRSAGPRTGSSSTG